MHRDVDKHPAPHGALRRLGEGSGVGVGEVGKHPAPEGALRKKVGVASVRESALNDVDGWSARKLLPDAAVEPHFIESHGGSQEFSAANARSA